MTHEDAGHYRAKHPAGTAPDPAVAAAVEAKAESGARGGTAGAAEAAAEGRITCTAAHQVATELGVPPAKVGTTIDLLEYRLIECELGLFGSSVELEIPASADELPQELRDRLAEAAVNGRVSCLACWKIADDLGLERRAASAACELLGLKIKPCQLGAF